MARYENLIVIWEFAPLGKSIRVIDENGETDNIKIQTGLRNPTMGDSEFLAIVNKLGQNGWQMVNVNTIDYGRGNFTVRAFLEKKHE